MRPSLKTAMRSLIVSASSWSWVTKTKVMPTSRWISLSSTCISRRSLRSRAPSGSSRSSTLGRFTSARASATRCRWPPESWCGRRAAYPSSRTVASASLGPLPPLGLGDLLDAQAVLDVLQDAHVREDRVVLEDGVHVPVVRRPPGHVLVAEPDRPGGRRLEARDQPQHGGLAGAGRPQHREELAVSDVEVQLVDGAHLVVVLAQPPHRDCRRSCIRHAGQPSEVLLRVPAPFRHEGRRFTLL